MTDLDKLIEAVERGDNFGIIPMTQAALTRYEYSNPHGDRVSRAFDGSLDAAKALHEALLPKRYGDKVRWSDDDGDVYLEIDNDYESGRMYSGRSSDPARSWLIAILKAYRSL